jgi:tetratricopeptide (TPR) repeat protein
LSFAVDPEYAVKLAERLYEYYIAKCCQESYEVGRSAFKLGWVYAYNTHLPDAVNQALNWLSKADKILSDVNLITTEEISKLTQTKVNLAKMYLISFGMTRRQKDYLMAKEYAEFNVEYSLNAYRPGDPQYAKLAGAHWQLADVLLAGGELESALKNIEKALAILITLNTENDSDSMHALNRKAAILFAMGRYHEAKPLAQKGAIGYTEYFGETHPTIVAMYSLLGDCCDKLGEEEEAAVAYEKALTIAKKLYAPGTKQIMELQRKSEKTKK